MSGTLKNPAKFAQLLASIRAKKAVQAQSTIKVDTLIEKMKEEQPVEVDIASLGVPEDEESIIEVVEDILSDDAIPDNFTGLGVTRDIILNAKQQEFVDLAISGRSCNLIGAAGTGKTTSMRKLTRALLDGGYLPALHSETKRLTAGHPGMVIVAFTNKAVNNIRHAVVDELKKNTLTIHKLLEFVPVFYDIVDPADPGRFKKTMKFEPTYHKLNSLPTSIKTIAFEESSMIGVDLYSQLQDAMNFPHQEIFLGDIQQLPPVFGPAILGFKLNELPTVELVEIYRQAKNSPIISLAWKLLNGDTKAFHPASVTRNEKHPVTDKMVNRRRIPALQELSRETEDGSVFFQPWQKSLSPEDALHSFCKQVEVWKRQDYYDPDKDIILCPYNLAFGTIEINKNIAFFLGQEREAMVYHVLAGFQNHYLAVGDRVLYNKEDAVIIDIRRNPAYIGKPTSPASPVLDRWGNYREKLTKAEEFLHKQETEQQEEEAFELMMNAEIDDSQEERKNQSSHTITVKYIYADDDDVAVVELSTAGEVNALLGGYAITVHKAQGSEWSKVFLVLHAQHVKMVSRELLYTAVTRARNSLHIICEPDSFYKGVKSQRISGNTLAQKAALFQGKAMAPGMKLPATEPLPEILIGKKPRNPYISAAVKATMETTEEVEDATSEYVGVSRYNESSYTNGESVGDRSTDSNIHTGSVASAQPKVETLAEKLARLKAGMRK